MTIRTSLRLTFAIVLLTSLAGGIVGIWSDGQRSDLRTEITRLEEIGKHVESLNYLAYEFLQHPERTRILQQWQKQSALLFELLAEKTDTFYDDHDILIMQAISKDAEFIKASFTRLHALQQQQRTADPIPAELHSRIASQTQVIAKHASSSAALLREHFRGKINRLADLSTWLNSIISGLLSLLVFLGLFWSERKISKPIVQLHAAVSQVIQGNYEKKIATVAHDEIGDLTHAFNLMIDTIKARNSELYELAARFQATFEQAAVGIAHVAQDGSWLRVNNKLCEIVGYSREELSALTFQDITHPDDLNADVGYVEDLLRGERDAYTMEKRYIRKNGSFVWVNLTGTIVRMQTPEPPYFIAVIENIEARKRAETYSQLLTAQLTISNQDLENFAYVASHDLKAPLRGIDNLANWLSSDLAGQVDEKSQRHLALLHNRVERMEALLDGLLQYSRIGRFKESAQSVDTTQLLADIIELTTIPEGFTVNVNGPLPSLEAEQVPLALVFRNLISNALKHHDQAEGRVDISARDVGNFIEFTVSDDGPGIAPKFHDKIFAIFQTLKPRDEVEGSGMGLALVKKATENQGGSVRVESNPEHRRGTAFVFSWPKQKQGI